MAWQYTIFGERFREGELTIPLAEKIEDAVEKNWFVINPVNSAKVARHMSAVLLSDRLGLTMEDAYAKVDTLTVNELLESVESYSDLPEAYDEGIPSSADEG